MQRQPWTFATALALASAVLAAVMAWFASAPSIAVTPDSVQYISAAQSIAAGHGVTSAVISLENPEPRVPLRAWPPLYPALLSLGSRSTESGSRVVDAGWIRGVNVVAFLLTFLPLSWLARTMVAGPGWVLVPLWYAAFRPNYLVASFAWAEPLFILLALTAIALTVSALQNESLESRNLDRDVRVGEIDKESIGKGNIESENIGKETEKADFQSEHLEIGNIEGEEFGREELERENTARERREIRMLLLLRCAGVLAGLAALCRYLGFALIAALAITVVLRSEGIRTRAALHRLLAVAWPALAPIGVWLGRNWLQTGRITDVPSSPSEHAVGRSLLEGLHTLARDWIAPAAEPGWLAPTITVMTAALAFWVIWTLATRFGPDAFEGDPARVTAATALAQYTWIHLALLLGAAVALPLDPVNTRLLAPIYPGLLLLAAGILRSTLQQLTSSHALALATALAWIATNQVAATAQYLVSPRDTRLETRPYWRTVVWNDARLRDGPSVAFLRQLPPDSVIVTNVWELVTFATGLPVKPWPDEVPRPSALIPALDSAYFLWNPEYRNYLPPPEQWIESRLPLRLLREWDGVKLYRIEHGARTVEADPSSSSSTHWAARPEGIDS